jgi:DNA-binding NarL/FixJ family response regulator
MQQAECLSQSIQLMTEPNDARRDPQPHDGSANQDHDAKYQPIQEFSPIARLSKRELEILKLLIDGRSNTEMATILYLSPNTIKTHIRGILNKLSVDNRIQAAVAAVRMGLL